MVAQEVIAAVESAVAQYERAIFEISNHNTAEADTIIKWLAKKNMYAGLCHYFHGTEYCDFILEVLELPIQKHLYKPVYKCTTKEQILKYLSLRKDYMKKYLAEWKAVQVDNQEASLF